MLIYFCINEINYWNTYTSKKIYDNENSSNYEYINDVIYPDYEKHTILLNLIKYLKDQKANSEKITKDAMLSTTTVTNLKNNGKYIPNKLDTFWIHQHRHSTPSFVAGSITFN